MVEIYMRYTWDIEYRATVMVWRRYGEDLFIDEK